MAFLARLRAVGIAARARMSVTSKCPSVPYFGRSAASGGGGGVGAAAADGSGRRLWPPSSSIVTEQYRHRHVSGPYRQSPSAFEP